MNELDTPERVHMAMLEGRIPRITMMMCAHTWGAEAVRELHYTHQLRADLKNVADVLINYDGGSPRLQALAALAKVEWLENELSISRKNERAAHWVLKDTQAELAQLRRQLCMARECMNANDPLNARTIFGPPKEETSHEQTARQTTGAFGTEQERT